MTESRSRRWAGKLMRARRLFTAEKTRPASAAVRAEQLEERLCLSASGISFTQSQVVDTQTSMVATGDFNHDGFVDLATVDTQDNFVRVYLNQGNGTFVKEFGMNLAHARWVTVADFNADGNLDLVVLRPDGDKDSRVSLLLGNGDGSFQKPVQFNTRANVFTSTTADFNGDGLPDLALSNKNHFSVMLNTGNATFAPPVFYGESDDPPRYITSADFNNDGAPDLALIRANNKVDIMLNQTVRGVGTSVFGVPMPASLGEKPQIVVPGDFNGDGNIDLASVNSDFRVAPVSILLGNGDGTFQPRRNYFGGNFVEALAVADFNGDGKLDLASSSFTSQMRVYPGNGDGTFLPETDVQAGKYGIFMLAADLNNDGQPDIIVVRGGSFRVLLNTSNTTPTPPGTPGTIDLNIGAGGSKSINFTPAGGVKATVSLSGPGSAVVRLVGDDLVQNGTTVSGENIRIQSIHSTGTTLSSSLSINSGSKSGVVDVDRIQVDGALKSLSAPATLLHISCVIGAAATNVKFDSATDASISIAQQTPPGTAALALNVTRADGMSVQSAERIKQLTLGQWISSDGTPPALSAPGVQNIQCAGAFAASLTIGAGGVGTFGGGGQITGGTWTVAGNIATLNLQALTNANITAAGTIGTISIPQKKDVAKFANSNVTAATITNASLGTIAFHNSGAPFGLAAHAIVNLSGKDLINNKTFSIHNVASAAAVDSVLRGKGIDPGDFSAQIV